MQMMERLPDGRIRVHVDCVLQKGTTRRIFVKTDAESRVAAARTTPMAAALGKAWRMRSLIYDGVYKGKVSVARALGVSRTHFAENINLTYLSPVIVERIMRGDLHDATVERYGRIATPFWYEQHKALGID